jgi:hypothetical protein
MKVALSHREREKRAIDVGTSSHFAAFFCQTTMGHLKQFTPFVTIGAARHTRCCHVYTLPLCFLMTFIYVRLGGVLMANKREISD